MRRTALLTLAVALLVGLPGTTAARAASAAADPCPRPDGTPVQLKASDGASVYGVEFGSGSTGVVLGHQLWSDHCEFVDVARELSGRGLRALAIDFRGYGFSRGGAAGRLDRDFAAAVRHLRGEGVRRVELVGASMGGTAALVASSWITPAVAGAVSLSGPVRFHNLDALRAVRRLHVPVRFLASKGDSPFSSDAVTLMKATAARDKAIARYPGYRHGSALLELPAARALVTAFLTR